MGQHTRSQLPLDGSLLTDEVQDRQMLTYTSSLTPEQELALLERARRGDRQARDDLFLAQLLPYSRYWAKRFLGAYGWAVRRIEYADLVQEASQVVLECFDRALAAENPVGYLCACAKKAIWAYGFRSASLIVTPSRQEQGEWLRPQRVVSLDAPLSQESEETLGNLLIDQNWQAEQPQDETSYQRLYQALAHLTDKQRMTIMRVFGVGEYPQELLAEVGRDLHISHETVLESRDSGLKRLYGLLSSETDAWYTRQQACTYLGVTANTFCGLMKRRGIKAVGRGVYKQADIEALAQEREQRFACGSKRMKKGSKHVPQQSMA